MIPRNWTKRKYIIYSRNNCFDMYLTALVYTVKHIIDARCEPERQSGRGCRDVNQTTSTTHAFDIHIMGIGYTIYMIEI